MHGVAMDLLFPCGKANGEKSSAKKNESWFAIGIENSRKEMIGFAVGIVTGEQKGEINKIYLLQEYHRLGIGKKLFAEVVRRFRQMGVNSMHLFGIPQNPSCRFHEAMGGQRMYNRRGGFDGGYQWPDLKQIKT